MNKINLINGVNPAQQKEISRWWALTIILLALTTLAIGAISVFQLQMIRKRAAEKKMWQQKLMPLQLVLDQEKALKQEEQALIKQITKLQAYSSQQSPVVEHFGSIVKHLHTSNAWLESLTLDKKSFELRSGTAQLENALKLAQLLTREPAFERVSVVSLQNKKKAEATQTLVTITGSIKKKSTPQASTHQINRPAAPNSQTSHAKELTAQQNKKAAKTV